MKIPHYQREVVDHAVDDDGGSEESSKREKEISFYALDCENIEDIIR